MSRSTTATTTYNLVKYSRSCTNGRSEAEQEWQHFTNPIITLVVDARKKANVGELESLRTRVIWTLSASKDSMDVDQREVVFEDLDMHVLSLTPPTHGLPLKAVYRDTVVGIRYMHPRVVPAGSAPTFKRFQITFQTAELAAAFIDSVKLICPCKANPAPVGRHTQMARSKTAIPGVAPTSAFSAQLQLSGPAIPPQTPTRIYPVASQTTDRRTLFSDPAPYSNDSGSMSHAVYPTEKLPALTDRLNHAYMPSQSHTPYVRPTIGNIPAAVSNSQTAPLVPASIYSQPQAIAPISTVSCSQLSDDPCYRDSRPTSACATSSAMAADYSGRPYSDVSQPPSDRHSLEQRVPGYITTSAAVSHMHDGNHSSESSTGVALTPAPGGLPPRPPSVPALTTPLRPPSPTAPVLANSRELGAALTRQPSASSDFLGALEETRSIYDLSRSDIECLIAKVVREDGFADLLEKIDSM
ncbi:uncharacterized protein B0H18DRAFT_1207200, partial [Fomitopsis serialis]|uniref:uncharacterized protein n=1 Tax=Fomitopsis serialis TaxID=139415 RepID=UPI0020077763